MLRVLFSVLALSLVWQQQPLGCWAEENAKSSVAEQHQGSLPTVPLSYTDYYHGDQACNLAAFGAAKQSRNRRGRHAALAASGQNHAVPNQATVICPLPSSEASQAVPLHIRGMDTVWLVENTASQPVVVAYVDTESGQEVSAVNRDKLAKDDPQALLRPGQYHPLDALFGETFVVRPVLVQTPSLLVLGPVWLRHTVGYVPIGGGTAGTLSTPPTPPAQTTTTRPQSSTQTVPATAGPRQHPPQQLQQSSTAEGLSRKPQVTETAETLPRPTWDHARQLQAQQHVFDRCHFVDVGFRNVGAEELEAYYVAQDEGTPRHKFHLGRNHHAPDFLPFSYNAATKLEVSNVGHTFQFFRSSEKDLVDTYTLQPTRVVDCPAPRPVQVPPQENTAAVVGVADPLVTVAEEEPAPQRRSNDHQRSRRSRSDKRDLVASLMTKNSSPASTSTCCAHEKKRTSSSVGPKNVTLSEESSSVTVVIQRVPWPEWAGNATDCGSENADGAGRGVVLPKATAHLVSVF